ncbi:YciI-like protein [Candidatus Leptofilum sp.]|uniref:YciI-like protein n=1 Tax=Candidatus Leptofilum sp. TaxID=3241576 RepID=UPI003B5B95BE
MNYYALIYHLTDDYLERRGTYRAEHLQLAKDAEAQGDLVLGGAYSDPADTALLVWRVEDSSVIETFVNSDPYVKNGLIARWEIRPWTVVIGTAYEK